MWGKDLKNLQEKSGETIWESIGAFVCAAVAYALIVAILSLWASPSV